MSNSPDAAASAASSARQVDRRRSVQDLLDEADASLRRGARPGATVWPTGFDLLDATLDGGLRSGELVLLGGRAAFMGGLFLVPLFHFENFM